MLCPKCAIECKIGKSYFKTVDDDTPDKKTKVYMCHDMVCRNKQCTNYDSVIETVENLVSE